MRTLFKSQVSSLLSTVVDFLITFALTELFKIWYLLSGIIGTVSGGIINFLINRHLVFGSSGQKGLHQASKYILVWIGYLKLSALGYYILSDCFKINYLISKVITSVLLGLTYNFLLQKYFVFGVKWRKS
jgi:putative flippase GtrA